MCQQAARIEWQTAIEGGAGAGRGGGGGGAGGGGGGGVGGGGEALDVLVEEVDVGEDRADDERVLVAEAALERLAQRRDLGAQPAARELGEHGWVGGASDERVQHR